MLSWYKKDSTPETDVGVLPVVISTEENRGKVLQDEIEQDENYADLKRILEYAFKQAAAPEEKGQARHGENIPIKEQTTLMIGRKCRGFLLGQALKKIYESQRLETNRAIKELLGAIVYVAFEIMILEDE